MFLSDNDYLVKLVQFRVVSVILVTGYYSLVTCNQFC